MGAFGFRRGGLAAMSLVAALAACSTPPPATFDLTAATGFSSAAGRGMLVVGEPVAVSFIDSERIAVRTGANGVAYLSGAQWPDRLPKLFQARLIQSFENARRAGSVARPGDRLVAAHQLNSDIRTFEIQEATGEAVVEITVRIVNDRSGRIVAAEVFSARVPVGAIEGVEAARALDQATQAVLQRIVQWASGRA